MNVCNALNLFKINRSSIFGLSLKLVSSPAAKQLRCNSTCIKMSDFKSEMPYTVCVEGNIGCGKTTLLNFFSQFDEVDVLHEPVKKWTNLKNFNLLDLMYKDPHRWSHLFQTYVQLTMTEQHIKRSTKKTKLMERSLFSARYCFVENLYKSGRMTEAEYKVYCEWFSLITAKINCRVDLFVYLRTDPNILHERILTRARTEEAKIPLDYLQSLHKLHEDWLCLSAFKNNVPVLIIDSNGSIAEMKNAYLKHMDQIIHGRSRVGSPLKLSKSPKELSYANEKNGNTTKLMEELTSTLL